MHKIQPLKLTKATWVQITLYTEKQLKEKNV